MRLGETFDGLDFMWPRLEIIGGDRIFQAASNMLFPEGAFFRVDAKVGAVENFKEMTRTLKMLSVILESVNGR